MQYRIMKKGKINNEKLKYTVFTAGFHIRHKKKIKEFWYFYEMTFTYYSKMVDARFTPSFEVLIDTLFQKAYLNELKIHRIHVEI